MMTLNYLHQFTIPTAYALLPPVMQSREATAMLLAIALQESAVSHRAQVNGPARGFWQFEVAGVAGVRQHLSSHEHVKAVFKTLCYSNTATSRIIQSALQDNDVLACVFARLLLWTLPERLPRHDDPDEGWRQYLAAWRPGKPHRERWDGCFAMAWDLVDAD